MHESNHFIPDQLRRLLFGILVLAGILIAIALLLPPLETSASAPSSSPAVSTMAMSDSPNAVTAGMVMATDELLVTIDSTERALSHSTRSAAVAVSHSGRYAADGLSGSASFVGRGLGRGAMSMAGTTAAGATLMARGVYTSFAVATYVPRTAIGFAADTAVVSAVIQPAKNAPVPRIDTALPPTIAGQAAAPAAQDAGHALAPAPQTQADTTAAWPIHGTITTQFGVPHWPYQPTHTGLDISDGQRSGITPIRPFRPGRVIDAVSSYGGLGNHVTVDHGGGITSVYGHMASISVQVGQAVDKTTVLGLEGSTGASTGTHLHFEVRLNGLAVDPRGYVAGQP